MCAHLVVSADPVCHMHKMQDAEYELQFLHMRRDLLTETAELINREWPRSLSAR